MKKSPAMKAKVKSSKKVVPKAGDFVLSKDTSKVYKPKSKEDQMLIDAMRQMD